MPPAPRLLDLEARIGYGFVTDAVVQVLSGRARSLHPLLIATALAFGLSFALE